MLAYRQNVALQRKARAIAVGACVLLAATGCDGRSRSVFAAYGDPASTRVELNVASCKENPTAEVVESDTEVRVQVSSGRWLGRNAGDCADVVVVTLDLPLRSRTVVDESTGQTVEVRRAIRTCLRSDSGPPMLHVRGEMRSMLTSSRRLSPASGRSPSETRMSVLSATLQATR